MPFLKKCNNTLINERISFLFIILVHMLLVFIFLTLAYYLFILPITEHEFDNQLEHITETVLKNITYPKWFLNSIDDKHIQSLIDIYDTKSQSVQEHNLWIKRLIVSIIILTICILTISMYGINTISSACVNPLKIVASSLLGFVFIMIYEGFFIYKIILKYIPTKPDSFLKSFIDTLNNQLYTLIS